MDPTQDPNAGTTWALSRLGFAIDTYVDRQINSPQRIDNPALQYGVDANGNLYQVGQPGSLGANGTQTRQIGISPLLLLAIGAVVLLAMH